MGNETMSSDGLAALEIDRSRPRPRRSAWLWAGGVALAAVAFFASGLWERVRTVEVTVSPAVKISAASAEAADGKADLAAAGYVVADRQSVLSAKYNGRLAKLHVAEADFVKKGDVVAELDHAELDATIVQAQAEVAEAAAEVRRLDKLAAQADAQLAASKAPLETLAAEGKQYDVMLADAKRRMSLAERLLERTAGTESEVDDRRTEVRTSEIKVAWNLRRKFEAEKAVVVAETQAAAARAAVGAAEARRESAAARVKTLESQRDEAFIRAPFDGMVTEKAAEIGEIVAPISIGGSMARGSIITLADWSSLQAEVDVAESQLARVKAGQRAAIAVDALPGKTFPGRVRRILPRADRGKATVKIRVDFLARDPQAVLPEMGVRVRFLADDAPEGLESGQLPDRIVVPKAAVQAVEQGRCVWVVGDDDLARRTAVEVAGEAGERAVIARGLEAGQRVVVDGADRLRGEVARIRLAERR